MKLLIISDTWHPQINGVVRTLEATAKELSRLGHETCIVGPDRTRRSTFALPFYPEIKLEFFARRRLEKLFREFQPDFIHIATEGPLGWAARRLCLSRSLPFTTVYHTRFPEYLAVRAPRVLSRLVRTMAYAILRRFHGPASAVMVATASIEQELRLRKFRRARALVARRRYKFVSPLRQGPASLFGSATSNPALCGSRRRREKSARVSRR